jgi:hypothetical protein
MPLAQERYHLDRHDYGRRLSIPFLRGYDQIGATGIVRSLELDLLTVIAITISGQKPNRMQRAPPEEPPQNLSTPIAGDSEDM